MIPTAPDPSFFESEAGMAIWLEPSLFRAMATCVSPSDKCRMLRTDMEQNHLNRRVLLSLIGEDMKARFEPEHAKLLDDLLAILDTLPGNQAQSCGYCLEDLTESAPEPYKDRVVDSMIGSRFKSVRDRAGRLIQRRWKPEYLTTLRELCPDRLGEATQTAYIDHEDVEKLYESRHSLCEHLSDRSISRLYRRIVGTHPDALLELREHAPVSYIYIAAKEGILVEPEMAFAIAHETSGTDKFGLVIWSIGRLKLWDVLTHICGVMDAWQRERHSAIAKRFGLPEDEARERLKKR